MKTLLRVSHVIVTVVLIIIAVGLLTACAVSQPQPVETEVPACQPLPESFQENDLIGTWIAEYFGGTATDTLIIKEDGTYKQIFTTNDGTRGFESAWKKWSLEKRPSGYIRLHMEGMYKCDNLESICARPSGGMDPADWAIDPCDGEFITMPDQVVLIVTGYPVSVQKGIVLRQPRVGGSEWDYAFKLQE